MFVRNYLRCLTVNLSSQPRSKEAILRFLPQNLPKYPSIDFTGKVTDAHVQYDSGTYDRVIYLGLGKELTHKSWRKSVHLATRKLQSLKIETCDVELPPQFSNSEGVYTLGLISSLSNYQFDDLISTTERKLHRVKELNLVMPDNEKINSFRKAADTAHKIAESVKYARDMGNLRADVGTPAFYENEAFSLSRQYENIEIQVLRKADLIANKMNLILAVGEGAKEEPRVVILKYCPPNPEVAEPVVVVGKGITFDSGGLHIKTGVSMNNMHLDMHGAATVLGLIQAAAKLQLRTPVVGVLALAENAIGSNSYKPLSIYRSMKGLSVEILNTDAEGRLVLADAFTYAQMNFKPKIMVDFATLTGACVVALGQETAGVWCNDECLAKELQTSAAHVFEKMWLMPFLEEAADQLKGTHSDLTNISKQNNGGGSCIAAEFLKNFVDDGVSWAHFDIAGPGMLSSGKDHQSQGATGFGIQTMIAYLQRLSASKSSTPS